MDYGFSLEELKALMEVQAIQIGLCHGFDLISEDGIRECKKWMAETHPGNLNISLDPNPSNDPMDIMMGNMKRRTLVNCMDGLLVKMMKNKEETIDMIKSFMSV